MQYIPYIMLVASVIGVLVAIFVAAYKESRTSRFLDHKRYTPEPVTVRVINPDEPLHPLVEAFTEWPFNNKEKSK